MNTQMRMMSLIAVVVLLGGLEAKGQTEIPELNTLEIEQAEAMSKQEGEGFGIHFQVGGLIRVATDVQAETKQNYIITADFSGLNWSRTEPTWGLGVHFALDDSGHRLGIKGLWRRPLAKDKWQYFQFAPGVYVSATDDTYDPSSPGYFFEVELGLAREFALVALVEFLPYKNRTIGIMPGPTPDSDWQTVHENGIATSLHMGAKAGQLAGSTLVGIAALVGLGFLISMGQNGIM